jgi:hypothetical protein
MGGDQLIQTCEETRECPIDPSTDDNHWDNISDVAFHHISHHAGVCRKEDIVQSITSHIHDESIPVMGFFTTGSLFWVEK